MIFKYIEVIKSSIDSINDFDDLDFFRQIRLLSEKCFYYYKVPDPVD